MGLNTNILTSVVNNVRSFFNKGTLIRIVKDGRRHTGNYYKVQYWGYDVDDINKVWGKCWNSIYIKESVAKKVGLCRGDAFALFLTKEEAKAIKNYFKSNPKDICLKFKYCRRQDDCASSIFEGCPFSRIDDDGSTDFLNNSPKNFCNAYEPED